MSEPLNSERNVTVHLAINPGRMHAYLLLDSFGGKEAVPEFVSLSRQDPVEKLMGQSCLAVRVPRRLSGRLS
jgi:hypothetical protein